MRRTLLIGASALALAACDPATFDGEAGRQLDGSTFGSAVENNHLVQTGQRSYALELGRRFAAEVPTTINFAFDSAHLDAEARAVLDQQAHWIRQFPEVRFRVYGHTDLVGSDAYNRRLGQRRANAVVNHLVSRGVERARLEAAVSLGRTQPVIPVPGPERANRRTVTEVTGFVRRHPTVMNGQYASIVYREYIASAVRPLPPISGTRQGVAGGN